MYKHLLVLILNMILLSCSGGKIFSTVEGDKGFEDGNVVGVNTSESEDNEKFSNGFTSQSKGGGKTHTGDQASNHWIKSVVFLKVGAGEFIMGSPSIDGNRYSDEASRKVNITKSFAIMETELTQQHWFNETKQNPSYFKESRYCDNHKRVEGIKLCPDHPVEKVSWEDVQEFIAKINTTLGLSGCNGRPTDPTGCYRLPTEAEWEYAIRGGSSGARTYSAYSFGNNSPGDYAWYKDNSGRRTHKVKQKRPNSKGLYDMHGNVWEMVQDTYSDSLLGGNDPLNSRSGFNQIVVRGGGWNVGKDQLRSSLRNTADDNTRNLNMTGFRLVKTL